MKKYFFQKFSLLNSPVLNPELRLYSENACPPLGQHTPHVRKARDRTLQEEGNWFFYLVLYQHHAGAYSYECKVELNSNLLPPTGGDVSKPSLGRNASLENSPHTPAEAWWRTKPQRGSCNENGWKENHPRELTATVRVTETPKQTRGVWYQPQSAHHMVWKDFALSGVLGLS